jgi:hypothetical protein
MTCCIGSNTGSKRLNAHAGQSNEEAPHNTSNINKEQYRAKGSISQKDEARSDAETGRL